MLKKLLLYTQFLFYLGAAINHFVNPELYLKFMPAWLPWQPGLIAVSGVAELALAFFLVITSTRRYAAWLIIAMLLVFLLLIHIPMAIDYTRRGDPDQWIMILRCPIQLLLMGWAWLFTRDKYN